MEHQLADIGQIALTGRDVATALPFYRDVLGLRFLFSPNPNLAFLRDPDGNLVGLMEEKRCAVENVPD